MVSDMKTIIILATQPDILSGIFGIAAALFGLALAFAALLMPLYVVGISSTLKKIKALQEQQLRELRAISYGEFDNGQ